MKYQVSNLVPKTSAKGTNYVQVSLMDEQNIIYDRINLFKGEATGKTEIEGNLVKNGEYWNFEGLINHTANFPSQGKSGMMAKAMETKADNIEHAQDRKNDAIATAGSITNATNLVTSMMEAGVLSVEELANIKGTITSYMAWYQGLYKSTPTMTAKEIDHANNAPF